MMEWIVQTIHTPIYTLIVCSVGIVALIAFVATKQGRHWISAVGIGAAYVFYLLPLWVR